MGLSVTNTVKRTASLPYKFGDTRYNCVREQTVVPEVGPARVYNARKTIGGNNHYFTAYRNGTGRVVFLQSNDPNLRAEKHTYVPQNVAELKRYMSTNDPHQWRFTPLGMVLVSVGCIGLTSVQRSPEWFLLRKFRFTSTVAVVPKTTTSLSVEWGRVEGHPLRNSSNQK